MASAKDINLDSARTLMLDLVTLKHDAQLLEDDELYSELSRKSLEAVKGYYNLETVNKERTDWWKRILKK